MLLTLRNTKYEPCAYKGILTQRMEEEVRKLEESYANRKEDLEKKYGALESNLNAEYDAENQKLASATKVWSSLLVLQSRTVSGIG